MYNFLKKSFITVLLSLFIFYVFADTTHIVAKGDTLYGIAKKYQISVSDLKNANKLSDKDVIKVGQKLTIPISSGSSGISQEKNSTLTNNLKTEIYTVKKGDTFYGIAKKYDINVSELYFLNSMSQNDVLKVGQKIKVPVSQDSIPDIKDLDPKIYTEKNTASGLLWPIKNPVVTYVKGKVSGVQLGCSSKETVTNIHAGTVMFTGSYRGFGEVVFVQSKTGLVYVYTGLNSVKVKKGNYVVFGDELGKTGIDSITKKNGIMLMVIQNGEYIDPAKAPRG